MAKENIKKTNALVLKGMDYRETSRIITAFSEGFGKIKLIAKGVRNPKSRMAAALQSLVNSEIVFYKKETTELYLVKETEMLEFFENIHNDLLRFNYGSVITDFLLNLLATEQVSKTLYQYSLYTLHRINQEDKNELPFILTAFLLKGAALLGFRIELEKCAVCGKKKFSPVYFSYAKGGLLCDECRNTDADVVNLSKTVYHFMKKFQKVGGGVHYRKMGREEFKEIFLLLQNWLNYHNHKELRTLDNLIKGKSGY